MKIVSHIARIILGLGFAVFGFNAFHPFMPMPEMKGYPAQFFGVIHDTGYLYAIAAFQVVGGLILLTGRFVPVGLSLLGPVIVNILLYHFFIDHYANPMAIVVALLELFLIWSYWPAFAGIFRARLEPTAS